MKIKMNSNYFPVIQQKGFSLTEVLVSTTILAVSILGIVGALPQSYQMITTSGRISTINHLGQQKLDELKSLSLEDADLLDNESDLAQGTVHPSIDLGDSTNVEFPFEVNPGISRDYSLRWTVYDDMPTVNMKTVIVEVGYRAYEYQSPQNALPNNAAGRTLTLLQTYVTD